MSKIACNEYIYTYDIDKIMDIVNCLIKTNYTIK